MEGVSLRLNEVRSQLPQGVDLVAVSKFHPVEALMAAYRSGQRLFGESRADELAAKAVVMPSDVKWHFIGHVQTNKLRRIMPHVAMIQSVDSERLLMLIDSEAGRIGRQPDVLLQVHVAAEETKTGFTPDELLDVALRCAPQLRNARICGVMGMATNTDDAARIASDFAAIAETAAALRKILPDATTISMGMSDDWQEAISHGSTMVRIGSAIFGSREY
ncbi:MAG: YggS family pyridoxal phosphate-dependent enzyme [Muribaculaceae bacterium]|nr:YggS family pyridoxal phosphate-dependent enzyme [Muribaculaceae bacterium]